MDQEFLIVTFESSHDAMKAETVLNREAISVRLIPVPPEVSAGCGLALRSELVQEKKVREILQKEAITGDFYRLIRKGIQRIVERMEQ